MTTFELPRTTTDARPAASRAWTTWLVVLTLGLALGAFGFVYQWSQGLGVTGLSNTITWGLYIVSFMFLVGCSAGGLIIVAGAELVGSHRFTAMNRLAVVVSGAAVATAAGTILPDLGRPQMAWKMVTQPHWTSPLMWDMVVIGVYLVIAAVDLYVLTRQKPVPGALRTMALITLPIAVLVHSITAWIFGLLVARPFWNTPLLAPMFITSALVSGTALVIVVAVIVQRTTSWRAPTRAVPDLGKLLLWFISVDAFLLFTEIMTTYTSGEPDHRSQLDVLLTGRLAPVFWAEVTLGLAVPFVLLSRRAWRSHTVLVVGASVLLLAGVLAKRINILFSAQFDPLLGLVPGIPGGRPGQEFRPDEVYLPTWVELSVLVGMAAFFAALVTIGVRTVVLERRTGSDSPLARER